MSEENKATKIYECIGLLSSMVNSGEAHTSKSKEVIADAKRTVAELESEIEISNKLIQERNRLLSEFDCPEHGQCVPFAIEEISKLRAEIGRYKTALTDAINRPKGVVPDSAVSLVEWM